MSFKARVDEGGKQEKPMIAAEFPGRSKRQQPPVKESFLAEKSAFQIKKFVFSEKEVALEIKGRLFSCKNGFSASLANGGVLL